MTATRLVLFDGNHRAALVAMYTSRVSVRQVENDGAMRLQQSPDAEFGNILTMIYIDATLCIWT